MSVPSSSPRSVDVGRPRRLVADHVLVLVLGILTVFGSTVAWDLPAGGLWIGLPLGLATLKLGAGVRRDETATGPRRMATAGIVLAVLSLAQMAVWTTVSLVS